MPIRADLRHLYRTPGWEAARQRVLERAGDKCEQCRVPNHASTWRGPNGMWRLKDTGAAWHRNSGNITTFEPEADRSVNIVLTVAHLNHVAGDDRDENLKALCQWCHLNYDALHHRATRCERKDAARPLLEAELSAISAQLSVKTNRGAA